MNYKISTLDVQAMIEEIFNDDVKKMYKTISNLEVYYQYGQSDEYLSHEQELEVYLAGYIERIHVKICTILDYYGLNYLMQQYTEKYNKMSNVELHYYSESGVLDSPIYGMMNDYIAALKFIVNPEKSSQHIKIDNNNYLKSDISNKIEYPASEEKMFGILFYLLNKVTFNNDEKEQEFQKLLLELKNNGQEDNKGILEKVKSFISETGIEYVKDEIKDQIPGILELITNLIMKL